MRVLFFYVHDWCIVSSCCFTLLHDGNETSGTLYMSESRHIMA